MNKVVLVLVDGMRPDAMKMCGNPFLNELTAHGAYTFNASTVMPSVTLPCHMSLFHSVTPERHGITTNTYVPQVRPIKGLCENLKGYHKKNAFFYNWEEIKDLSRPDSMATAYFASGHVYGYEEANRRVTEACVKYISEEKPDFVFLYLGWTDGAGHDKGWMGEEYLRSVNESLSSIKKVASVLDEDYTLVVTADHGGHDRCHGTDKPEDMTIPLFFYRASEAPKEIKEANIIDIAPTIARILGTEPESEWDGRAIEL